MFTNSLSIDEEHILRLLSCITQARDSLPAVQQEDEGMTTTPLNDDSQHETDHGVDEPTSSTSSRKRKLSDSDSTQTTETTKSMEEKEKAQKEKKEEDSEEREAKKPKSTDDATSIINATSTAVSTSTKDKGKEKIKVDVDSPSLNETESVESGREGITSSSLAELLASSIAARENNNGSELECPVCMDQFGSMDEMHSLIACHHVYCR